MARINVLRFTRSLLLNKFSSGQCYTPLNAQIELTLRCNARCVFCSIWQKDFQKEIKTEMTTDEVKKIVDDLNDLGVNIVSLTGGEPTLRKDLGELVDYVRKKGMTPSIATNGYYLHDLLRSGKLKNVEWIMVSIDWPDAERHDKYRGIKVFDRAVEGIKTAIEMKKQAFISTVVTKENIHCMEEMLTFAQNLGVMVEMLPCEDIIREQEHCAHVVEDIESYIPDLNFYASEIRRLEKKYHNLFTDSVTANIIESGGFGNQNYLHCVSARSYLFIKADGFLVFPCKIHPLLKIDVRKYDLKQAYHSYEAKKIMDMQDRFPFCKGCRFGCAIATSIPTRMAPLYQKYMKAFFRGNMF